MPTFLRLPCACCDARRCRSRFEGFRGGSLHLLHGKAEQPILQFDEVIVIAAYLRCGPAHAGHAQALYLGMRWGKSRSCTSRAISISRVMRSRWAAPSAGFARGLRSQAPGRSAATDCKVRRPVGVQGSSERLGPRVIRPIRLERPGWRAGATSATETKRAPIDYTGCVMQSPNVATAYLFAEQDRCPVLQGS